MAEHVSGPDSVHLAWAQVALASDYSDMVVMRALHKAVHRVYRCGKHYAGSTG